MSDADEMYGDGANSAKPPPMDAKEKPEAEKEGKAAEYPEQLLNKEICPGMKVGDEMVVKIVGETEREYRVQYAPEPEHKEETQAPEPGEEVDNPKGPMSSMYA